MKDPAPPAKCASYLDNIETGTVLGPSSNADPDQVLGIFLQGDLPRHSGDSSGKRSKHNDLWRATGRGRLPCQKGSNNPHKAASSFLNQKELLEPERAQESRSLRVNTQGC